MPYGQISSAPANPYQPWKPNAPQAGYRPPNNIPNFDKINSALADAMEFQQQEKDKAAAEREVGYGKLENQISVATNPQLIKDYYSQVMAQLGQNASSQAARSRSSAAAMASQRGLANPSGFVSAVGNQAMAPYQATQGQATISQADALQKIETKKFELMYLVNRARQGDADSIARLELEKQRLAAAQEAGEAGWADYFGIVLDVGAAILSGGATIPLSAARHVGSAVNNPNDIYQPSYG